MSGAESQAPLGELRNAIATLRGIELLKSIQVKAEANVEHDEAKRISYLTDLFITIHAGLFANAEHSTGAEGRGEDRLLHIPGEIPGGKNGQISMRFRAAVEHFVSKNGDTSSQAQRLFDSNGMVVRLHKDESEAVGLAAHEIAKFYKEIKAIGPHGGPFDYGNEVTLNMFIAALGRLPAFRAAYPGGIDFRRMDKDDFAALNSKSPDTGALATAFAHAMDASRTPALLNLADQGEKLREWPKSKVSVASIPFLAYKGEASSNQQCLVTVNGGLVPLAHIQSELEKHINSDEMLATFRPMGNGDVIGYLPGTETLREKNVTNIDGIPVTPESAPLCCLDMNILSGLRDEHHHRVMDLLKKQSQIDSKEYTLFSLRPGADDDENAKKLAENLRILAGDDRKLQNALSVACNHINNVTDQLNKAEDQIFHFAPGHIPKKYTPSAQPNLFMCMGGGGSGKTAVEELARAQCGENFVEASLDKFRDVSKLYTLLRAANHHADDYSIVEPMANALRQWVAETARANKINVLYDGTGIPFEPRYAKIVSDFKKSGYETTICGVDTDLEKAIQRVGSRFEQVQRALPWIVVTGKHTRAPEAMLQAEANGKVDKMAFFSNNGEKDRHYPFMETFTVTQDDLRELQKRQRSGGLADHFRAMMRERPDSILRAMATHDGAVDMPKLDELIARNTQLHNNNTAYNAVQIGGGKFRVEAIYDVERYIAMMEKGMLNPQASHKEGLRHLPDTVTFHVPSADRVDGERPWMLTERKRRDAAAPAKPSL